MITQFDVFVNPVPRARRAYPLVVILQADQAATGNNRIVAPLVRRARSVTTMGRLTPRVNLDNAEHVVFVPALMTVLVDELREHRGQLARYRDDLVAALDYLFLGV
ncbi:MAG TPA: CcdB family protein [Kofleriaceae bacterium]